MQPLEFRLRPRPLVVFGAFGLLALALGMLWTAPVIGALVGLIFLPLTVLGVLPYWVRAKWLVIGDQHIQLPAGWAWSGATRYLPYRDVRSMTGLLESGDSTVYLHDREGRDYAIVADLLPSKQVFELVVRKVQERVAQVQSSAADS
ncbi:MAG TPA: hypothetical protein VM261_29030 [Kofleriaceae bacterium]|nr:hypothetical protein [Kofleriaceae bacterium]